MARRVIALILGSTTLLACSGKDDPRPPRYTEAPKENLLACPVLRDDATLVVTEDGLLSSGSVPAECAAEGLSCPLEGVVGAVASCDAGKVPVARCAVEKWRLTCVDLLDPSAGGAGYDGQGGATGGSGGDGGRAGQVP
jgi:hypothetical protein